MEEDADGDQGPIVASFPLHDLLRFDIFGSTVIRKIIQLLNSFTKFPRYVSTLLSGRTSCEGRNDV